MLNFSIVFPGQGSQSVGMLKALSETYPIIRETFDTASKVLGFDCWELAQHGPEEKLNQTAYTQPVLLAADIALWRLYKTQFPARQPAWLAGHSLGEYAALVAAEAMTFEQAVFIVHERGKLMQWAAPKGSEKGCMAAILGLDNNVIETVCKEITGHRVAPANYNAIGQTVIAGHPDAVAQAVQEMKQKGAKRAIVLPVSVPSHCALMQPAADKLAILLETIEIKTPKIPILHNRDVQIYTEAHEIRRILCEQLVHPVRWVETIQALARYGVSHIIECGPGKVLSGLIKRIDSDIYLNNMDTPESLSEIACLQPIS